MERTQIFDLMGELKLYGMKAAFDEIMATAVKRQHEPQRIVGDLLSAEINENQARSIKYQLTIAKLPLAKDIADLQFDGTPINQTLVDDLAGGGFIAQQRNVVLVGGTGIIAAVHQPAPRQLFSVAASTAPVIRIRAPAANAISIAPLPADPPGPDAAPDSETTLAGTKATCCVVASFGSG